MENATQAILIAGGILLAMLILSVGMSIFITQDKTADAITTKWDTVELNKYNESFVKYEGRTDVTAQDIVSLVNLSKQREGAIIILVETKTGNILGTNNLTVLDKDDLTQFLNDHIVTTIKDPSGATTKKNTFSFVEDSIKYDEETGQIYQIKFKEN